MRFIALVRTPWLPLHRHVFPECSDQTVMACSECLAGLSGTLHIIPSSLLQPQLFSLELFHLISSAEFGPWEVATLDYSVCGPVPFPSCDPTGKLVRAAALPLTVCSGQMA